MEVNGNPEKELLSIKVMGKMEEKLIPLDEPQLKQAKYHWQGAGLVWIAAEIRHLEVLRALLLAGAPVIEANGVAPETIATRQGHSECASLLQAREA